MSRNKWEDCSLSFPSGQTAEPMEALEALQAIMGVELATFDLLDPNGDPVFAEQIMAGFIKSFSSVTEDAVAKLVVNFDITTMPPGLRGGWHKLEMRPDGACEIPQSMFCDEQDE